MKSKVINDVFDQLGNCRICGKHILNGTGRAEHARKHVRENNALELTGLGPAGQNKRFVPLTPIRKDIPMVIIRVSGGVAEVIEQPKGVRVRMIDYDVEGCEDSELEMDASGDQYRVIHDE